MAKINIKNSIRNPLIAYIKERSLSFKTNKRIVENNKVIERITISVTREEDKLALTTIANGYGSQLYHDTTLRDDMKLDNVYVYSSNDYENATRNSTELELPNYYLENLNEQNAENETLKALKTNIVSKEFIKNLTNRQGTLTTRTQNQILKFRNILFGNNYSTSRSNKNLKEFPYYNTINILSQNGNNNLSMLLKKLSFQEEILGGLLSEQQSVNVSFAIEGVETTIPVIDFIDMLNSSSLKLNIEDKLILGTPKINSNFMVNNFKKNIIQGALYGNLLGDLPSFKDMYESVEVKKESLVYKIDKFGDESSQPIQTFWKYDNGPYYDYQIKRDKTYRYKSSSYCLLYGVETRVQEVKEGRDSVEVVLVSTPSYKYTVVEFDEASVKVSPKIPMPPFASFHNENNEENIVKIYLSLNNDSNKSVFIPLTEEDSEIIKGIESQDGLYNFDYEIQDGKFEVYRLAKMPMSYFDFEDAKILDVRNKISTTDVIFKENVKPNKKYYFMFRSVNVIGVPSNPSPVYEVELIKMASTSKVVVNIINMEEKANYMDKHFKNLIQIKPAFHQEIFDDQNDFVRNLSTFKKKINDITLGTASDKVWGKKFKIRVKSKDSGKIIDLNVKFNLIKDNIK
jgi:hypothetical protein